MPLQGNATFDLPKACDYLPDAFTADPKLIAQALERPSSGKAIDNHLVPDLVCHPLSSPLQLIPCQVLTLKGAVASHVKSHLPHPQEYLWTVAGWSGQPSFIYSSSPETQ